MSALVVYTELNKAGIWFAYHSSVPARFITINKYCPLWIQTFYTEEQVSKKCSILALKQVVY